MTRKKTAPAGPSGPSSTLSSGPGATAGALPTLPPAAPPPTPSSPPPGPESPSGLESPSAAGPGGSARPIDRLIAIMARLRDPQAGCPWDREQTFATIAPYTIEEAYEVADAIARGDMAALVEELGDLLFQVVFYAQMGREAGQFDFDRVAEAIADKMLRRHPHVFGPVPGIARIESAAAQTDAWETHKAAERRAAAAARGERESVLDGIPRALPALTRAEKLQKRAARVGFDWPEVAPVLDKIEEEIAELRAELAAAAPVSAPAAASAPVPAPAAAPAPAPGRVAGELGDLMFALVNLARHLGINAEQALGGTNAKFERRFHHIEARLAEAGRAPNEASLDEMEALWTEAKGAERDPGTG